MDPLKILMTGAGAPGFASIFNCLRYNGERDLQIVGVDMNPFATGRTLTDKFYTVPEARDPGFIDAVLDICREERPDALISIVTRELELFAEARSRFEELGTKLDVMDPAPLHVANNKGLLLTRMKEAGLPTPEFVLVNTPEQLEDAVRELGYPGKPVVVKPVCGNGSRGIRILDATRSRYEQFFNEKPNSQFMRLEELKAIISERGTIPEMMVMEYLPNGEISVDLLADHGETLYYSCRQGVVVSSIMVSSEIRMDRDAVELAKAVAKEIKLDGTADFDLRRDSEGKPQLMEINPRLPAGIACSVAAGINFPYLRIKQILGEELPELSVTEGYSMQFRNEAVICRPDGSVMDWRDIYRNNNDQ